MRDFAFISAKGKRALVRLGVSVDPYDRESGGIGSDVHYEGVEGLAWRAEGVGVEKHFGCPIYAYPSPDMAYVVVVFCKDYPTGYAPPNNALVLNADGSIRLHVKQPSRYAGKPSEFYDAWWYELEIPRPREPSWLFWSRPALPRTKTRMKMLILPYRGNPTGEFEALDFDPASGEFGELVDSGRL
jgi:hypothetical protein